MITVKQVSSLRQINAKILDFMMNLIYLTLQKQPKLDVVINKYKNAASQRQHYVFASLLRFTNLNRG